MSYSEYNHSIRNDDYGNENPSCSYYYHILNSKYTIKKESKKAILISIDTKEVWLPKSSIIISNYLSVPRWLAINREIASYGELYPHE